MPRSGTGNGLLRLWAVAGALLLLSGCAATSARRIEALERPSGDARIVVMPLDVELSELTAGGLTEVKADWTEAAKTHLLAAFRERQEEKALNLTVYDEAALPAPLLDRLHQIERLHGAVGATIVLNARPGTALPTKEGRLDWSLGTAVAPLRDATRADYALFTYIRDSYASGPRVVLIVLAGLAGVPVPGGTQMGFASLVDLRSGDIVWFNRLEREVGDLRTAAAARETAEMLLTDFPK